MGAPSTVQLLNGNATFVAPSTVKPKPLRLVKLRYFVGLKHQEIADALGLGESTVRAYWAAARVRLFELIEQQPTRAETRR